MLTKMQSHALFHSYHCPDAVGGGGSSSRIMLEGISCHSHGREGGEAGEGLKLNVPRESCLALQSTRRESITRV
jgi:hypothetical protein